ncbi:MAG: hypothetical protein CL477_20280 [Acidobacteria bacterium]|jgi:ribosomal protein S18 acetylase RimI-like enzyme|nr:hypothetical protein [Acidobacteriota bacterium]HJN42619.1 GNAT family N-acetyltransferase [Vicinamibacterales bacterium]|tara:strand:+ start:1325 stop:2128 length:804 start_codon:yes stop_codon:yes gene_type:complete
MPQLTDPHLIRERLEADRAWAAFALADLEPPYSAFASWFCPTDGPAIALLYRAFATPILLCVGTSRNWDAVLDEVDIALRDVQDVYAVVRPETLPLIKNRYASNDERSMVRMVLEPGHHRPVISDGACRLGPDDLEAVQRLYLSEPPDFFLPSMLTDGLYYGIREGEQLVAVAGTHVLAPALGVGALGNVYTRSEHRRRGHATALAGAVTSEMIRSGVTTIVLNVREDNHSARRVYERLGFNGYCSYFEVSASRRPVQRLQPTTPGV